MATPDYFHKITPFWDDAYKQLDYTYESFNDLCRLNFGYIKVMRKNSLVQCAICAKHNQNGMIR